MPDLLHEMGNVVGMRLFIEVKWLMIARLWFIFADGPVVHDLAQKP